MTRVLQVDPARPDPDALAEASSILRGGGLVVYPTETVYGVAANALSADALLRLSRAKQRPPDKPYPVQIGGVAALSALADGVSADVWAMARALWPGPLTLIVRRRADAGLMEVGGGDTVGVRVPAHPVALGLLKLCGMPLACPSANVSGRPPPQTAPEALCDLDGAVDLVLDGGPTGGTVASTVLDVTTRPARLLRVGPISRAELERYLTVQE